MDTLARWHARHTHKALANYLPNCWEIWSYLRILIPTLFNTIDYVVGTIVRVHYAFNVWPKCIFWMVWFLFDKLNDFLWLVTDLTEWAFPPDHLVQYDGKCINVCLL